MIREKYIDLHTHSKQSDGSMTPAQVVDAAKDAGLSAVALTDHDTVSGVEEAMLEGEKIGVEVVPAVEFSASGDRQTHILCFYPDLGSECFRAFLNELIEGRKYRNAETERLLTKLGYSVSLDEVRAIAGGSIIGRAHFARLLTDKGVTKNVKEAFERFLAVGKPAYCDDGHPSAEKIIETANKSGGFAFAAHLNQMELDNDELYKVLTHYKECGLSGVEGYYTEYTDEMQRDYQAMAKRLDLMLSGGSDFHGSMKPHISIGRGTGNLFIPYSVLEIIKNAKEK